ncbi:type II 3-dehydroquinate dehydratase [Clostridium cochlearium]|uniref:3-dehydroquinate dehydratase n=1 Tax=Clostridium cochlearium TaxID=1494 RepID=A0A1G9H494_CLOCO|nr:type II 3-dehydroquinate dehydratase [Clostridium cochlearium]NSJ90781.1 type II 3-dehydroquinate dehydratase [Coprococcus sp. MSK.21.13]MBE6065340.1 type II 3-dehydroquinate dehydratase [Clostridium cochlearium]MBU5268998.1 type II 3-dehydroquinate dehydratase [Clostridium cochlearium]MCG4579574.1 type II 3-dehydroquinate dehydratase [Clostridium cochlearium]MDU1443765.1 type II 3-dehydroquinate dehydratase [Clostridium cochlearium]
MNKLSILVINGPNLNLLGTRETDIYGSITLEDMNSIITENFDENLVKIDFYQSNIEGEIVSKIGNSPKKYNGIVINPAAYSHYSIAILDAIRSIDIPVIEVHISNICKREEYRKKSVTGEGCIGVISGFGYYGYIMAINYLLKNIK